MRDVPTMRDGSTVGAGQDETLMAAGARMPADAVATADIKPE
jgi:hypothetical protein